MVDNADSLITARNVSEGNAALTKFASSLVDECRATGHPFSMVPGVDAAASSASVFCAGDGVQIDFADGREATIGPASAFSRVFGEKGRQTYIPLTELYDSGNGKHPYNPDDRTGNGSGNFIYLSGPAKSEA